MTYRRRHPARARIGWTRPGTEEEYEIHVEVSAGDPGCRYGLPENCYEPEPPEVEVLAVADYEGTKRPDLIPEAAADLDAYYAEACEAADDLDEAAAEDAAERAAESRCEP